MGAEFGDKLKDGISSGSLGFIIVNLVKPLGRGTCTEMDPTAGS